MISKIIYKLSRKIYLIAINEAYKTYCFAHNNLIKMLNDYRKENDSLSGRIKILEEQQLIMHNFLVEINKYLANISKKNLEEEIKND